MKKGRKRVALREHTVECELTVPWVCNPASSLPGVLHRPVGSGLGYLHVEPSSVGLALGAGRGGRLGNTFTSAHANRQHAYTLIYRQICMGACSHTGISIIFRMLKINYSNTCSFTNTTAL